MYLSMPKTLTLKNIPDAIYDRLKLAAQAHHRSVNSEVIVCLEAVVMPTEQMTVSERLDRARQLRGHFLAAKFDAADVDFLEQSDRL